MFPSFISYIVGFALAQAISFEQGAITAVLINAHAKGSMYFQLLRLDVLLVRKIHSPDTYSLYELIYITEHNGNPSVKRHS